MLQYKNNQEFYDDIERTIRELSSGGFLAEARKISFLLHSVAWTSSSELFRELRIEFNNLLMSSNDLNDETNDKLRHFVTMLDKA